MAIIWIVEDDDILREAFNHILEPLYRTHLLTNLGQMQHMSIPPDVIILDLALEDSVGVATVQSTREICPDAQIVVVTGSPALLAECMTAGANSFLVKGEAGTDLVLEEVQKALSRKDMTAKTQAGKVELREVSRTLNELHQTIPNPSGTIKVPKKE